MKVCPVCSTQVHLQYRLSAKIFKCSNCGLHLAADISFNKSFSSDYDQEKGFLALKELRTNNSREIVLKLKKNLRPYARGLEVGCSSGWFLDVCKANNVTCIGIEPELSLADLAKHKGHTIITGFFPKDLDSKAKDFDFIAFNDVFEHLPDINHAMETCYQLLEPGGILVINLPLSTGFFYRTAAILCKMGFKKPMGRLWQLQFHSPHFNYFNKSNLTRLAESKGFSLTDFHHLPTLTKDSIKFRIEMDKNQTSVISKITATLLKLIFPLIAMLPQDTGCFYFKKAAPPNK